jgi:Tol biopolymer transport system component
MWNCLIFFKLPQNAVLYCDLQFVGTVLASAMPEPFDDTRSSVKPPEGQLNSWKEIAAYLARDVTTVQRWEKREGMPVHRHLHDKIGSVYAFRSELDAWARSRNLRGAQESAAVAASPPPVVATELASPKGSEKRGSVTAWIVVLAAAGLALAAGATLLLQRTDYFWHNPIEGARFQTITDFDGVARDAVLSRDGHLVAFLSDHGGQMDVWVSQIGSGQFHNLTSGSATELVNPSIRTLGFSADSSLITYWVRNRVGSNDGGIGIWAVPTLGGQPRPYLDGVAELDWSPSGSRLAYHTPSPGDPLFVADGLKRSDAHPIFTAPAGLHAHFPLWSPDTAFIYFVLGALPDKLDIWRITDKGRAAERITSHYGIVSHPVLMDQHTLMYLASDPDGSGPWLYGMDLGRRTPHRLTSGPERYTSVAASSDGRRVVVTLATPKRTLWRLPIVDRPTQTSAPAPIAVTTSAGFFPRFGPNYLIYVSSTSGSDSIWRFANGIETELWSAQGSQVPAAPAISADGRSIAFSVRQNGRNRLYLMQADGTNLHLVTDSQDLQGAPAWDHDGQSITSAVSNQGVPHLFRFPANGRAPISFVNEYSVDPVWAPDGRFAVYSGVDIGTTFSIKAVNPDGTAHQVPPLTLTRGARHVMFTRSGSSLILLRGDIQHKDLWAVDLQTGAERQLTRLPADFDIREFDLSPDGREVVLERVQERSDIVLLDVPRR